MRPSYRKRAEKGAEKTKIPNMKKKHETGIGIKKKVNEHIPCFVIGLIWNLWTDG